VTSARLAAARALIAITDGQATLGAAVDKERGDLTDPRDRALTLELVAGALRWRNALDAVITSASRRSTTQIEAAVLAVLRLGAYQLGYLDRVPAHAVVSESVESVRSLTGTRAAGFVNAVLRTLTRRGPALALPMPASAEAPESAQVAYLSTTLSHPEWLVRRWLARYGYEATARWCAWNNQPPAIVIRAVRGVDAAALLERLESAGVRVTPSPFVKGALRLAPGELGRLPADLAADLRVQDEGAQLVAHAAAAAPGERVLDLCAAPGGKSLVLADDLDLDGSRSSVLVSADHRAKRVALLATTLRAQLAQPRIVRLNARVGLPFDAAFDCVLADVPCSGVGTLRRDPDLKWTRSPDDLPALATAALEILRAAADAVRPGGRLVYATCSSEPEENEAVVETFLAGDARFGRHRFGAAVPDAILTSTGDLATRPDRDGLDAFFAAQLVRRAGA
jgi:16S rRNA (cytosine967-C5)-methyltransferase